MKDIRAEHIADVLFWKGNPQKLLRGLIDSGWIDEKKDKAGKVTLIIHDWKHYAGAFLRFIEQNRERQRRWREKHNVTRNVTPNVTKPLRNAQYKREEEIRREDTPQEGEGENPSPPTSDPTLDVFVAAFMDTHKVGFKDGRPIVIKHLRKIVGCGLPEDEILAICRSPFNEKPWDVVNAVQKALVFDAKVKSMKGGRP